MLAALVGTQVVLRRGLRRRVNPAIAAATVIALAVTIVVPVALATAGGVGRGRDPAAAGRVPGLTAAHRTRTPASIASRATYSDSIDSGSSSEMPSTCSTRANCW